MEASGGQPQACDVIGSGSQASAAAAMAASPEMSIFQLRINQVLLVCTYCRQPLRPDMFGGMTSRCAGGHIYCGDCTERHEKACISYCRLLDDIILQMKFKCNYCDSGSMPYRKFVYHLCDIPFSRVDPKLVKRQLEYVYSRGECILNTSLLVCSECELPLRPPIFRHFSRDIPVCSACYRGDIANYVHCSELDYLVHGITVKCVACEQYLPFPTLASHQLDDCPFKHKLQKIAPGSSARKNFCDEEETEGPTTCNSCIHGKNKQKAPYEVGKMDKNIVHEDEVGNDDDSSDDNHPESGMRVAENAFKTRACNKKVKIATPYGQKTAPTAAQACASPSRCLPVTAPSKPRLPPFVPRRPGTRHFQAAHNRNRGDKMGAPVATLHPANN